MNELRANEPHCQIYIVATKADLLDGSGGSGGGVGQDSGGGDRKRDISAAAAQKFAASIDAAVFSTSAMTGQGLPVSGPPETAP